MEPPTPQGPCNGHHIFIYTFTDAARRLGVERRTVYGMVADGRLLVVQEGHRRGIYKRSLWFLKRHHRPAPRWLIEEALDVQSMSNSI